MKKQTFSEFLNLINVENVDELIVMLVREEREPPTMICSEYDCDGGDRDCFKCWYTYFDMKLED